jgi:hypothetical protein
MSREPKVYIAVEDEAGQLIVHGPLELLDRLVTTLTRQSSQSKPLPERATEPQEAVSTEADHV